MPDRAATSELPDGGAPSRPHAQWLLLFRVASSAVLLAGGGVIHVRAQVAWTATPILLFYGSLGTAFVLALAVAAAMRARSYVEAGLLGDLQLVADVVVTTILVYATGGADSVLTFLYPLNTLYAAALLSAPAGYAVAVTGAAAFAGLVALQVTGVIPRFEDMGLGVEREAVSVVTATAGANFLVAMLAGQLSDQLRRSGETLKRTRVDLGELRALQSAIVQSVATGLISTDEEGTIQFMNPAAAAILGVGDAEARGGPVSALLPGVHVARGSTPPPVELVVRAPGGGERRVSVGVSLLGSPDGRRRGAVINLLDVTEQRQLEEAMARSNRLATVGQFAAGLAHELRNPLGSMIGCVELLQQSGRDGDEARLLSIIHRESERLARLVHDFLAFARPQPPALHRVELRGILVEMADTVAHDSSMGVTVNVNCPPDLCVRADSGQLRQVLWNLLRNAAQASPPGSPVTLAAARTRLGEGRGIRITVADRGPGVDPAAASRLFEPFFTTRAQGTGLGLATVHRIVEQHRGEVGLEAAGGPGAVFYVTLPEDDGSPAPVGLEIPPDTPAPVFRP